jgi:hypothetical protein
LDEFTAAYSQHLLSVQSQPWFRRRLSSRTRRAITAVTEGDRAIAEDDREIMADGRAITEGGREIAEDSKEITAAARGTMGATTKQARSPTCC